MSTASNREVANSSHSLPRNGSRDFRFTEGGGLLGAAGRVLRQGLLDHTELDVAVHADEGGALVHLDDLAEDAAVADDHLVALLERVLEGFEFLLLLALRTDHEEVHHDEHQQEHDPQGSGTACGLALGLGLENQEKRFHMQGILSLLKEALAGLFDTALGFAFLDQSLILAFFQHGYNFFLYLGALLRSEQS